jgi:hypothetical protein
VARAFYSHALTQCQCVKNLSLTDPTCAQKEGDGDADPDAEADLEEDVQELDETNQNDEDQVSKSEAFVKSPLVLVRSPAVQAAVDGRKSKVRSRASLCMAVSDLGSVHVQT